VVLLLLPNRSVLRLVPLISMPMSSFMISYDILRHPYNVIELKVTSFKAEYIGQNNLGSSVKCVDR